jgi:hypothetical protein
MERKVVAGGGEAVTPRCRCNGAQVADGVRIVVFAKMLTDPLVRGGCRVGADAVVS